MKRLPGFVSLASFAVTVIAAGCQDTQPAESQQASGISFPGATATAAGDPQPSDSDSHPPRNTAVKMTARSDDLKRSDYRPMTDSELRDFLTPLQYSVTQKEGTERAFTNEYNDNKADGIYVDIVSGAPLFSSRDKFDSGTGWPSFTRPIDKDAVEERQDNTLFMRRVEVRSRASEAHLGHVFDDGPPPTGLRYCMNSAALRFIPREKLEELGYGEFASLFENAD